MAKTHSYIITALAILFFCYISACINKVNGQNVIGLPSITNFDLVDAGAGTQTWAITQDKSGILYFANTDGLVIYNGSNWQLYTLPNRTVIRSVNIGDDGKIFVGGQDELGYFFPSSNGTLTFHSLKKFLPASESSFADVWNTETYRNEVFFQCSDRIFRVNLQTKESKVFSAATEWTYMNVVNGKLYAQVKGEGLFRFNNNQWLMVTKAFNDLVITSIVDYNPGELFIATLKDGVFLLKKDTEVIRIPIDQQIQNDHIYKAFRIDKRTIGLGTTSDGLYLIDSKGQTTRHLTRADGLQNNIVLSAFVDAHSNLWLGLDNGVDHVRINSAIQKISPIPGSTTACYASLIFQNKLYVGTSDGLYVSPLSVPLSEDLSSSKGVFTRINRSGGQVWSLFPLGNELLMGHHEGTFLIKNGNSVPIHRGEGTWLFKRIPGSMKNFISGTYRGLDLYAIEGNLPKSDGRIPDGLPESFRFLEIDSANSVVWAAHPYRGIYKISMDKGMRHILNTRLYTDRDGLPATLDNYVFSIRHQIVFCTAKGIYIYDKKEDKFLPSANFEKIFGVIPIRLIREDTSGNIWFVSGKKLGVVLKDKTTLYFPELTGKMISGFESVYPVNDQNIFVNSTDGVIHINLQRYRQKPDTPNLLLGKVVAIGKRDSILYNGYFTDGDTILHNQPESHKIILPARYNSFHFEFSVSAYKAPGDFQYSYQLAGFDQQWSRLSTKSEKDYTNLPYGHYTFRVKAVDNIGSESRMIQYSFYIRPHWYQTKIAYLIYFILLAVLIWQFRKYQLKKFEKQRQKYEEEQAQLRYVHQLEKEHDEGEIIRLQKQNLEDQVTFKNKELATTTMHLVQRGKLLSKLKEELQQGIGKISVPKEKKYFTKLLKTIGDAEMQDDDWEHFAIHFDEVHNNFLKKLKDSFPELTQSDLKICAYLKMNLTSKEMAQLMNISLKAVEIARYRLRKRLGISSTPTNLHDFLMKQT